jgi:hypothetical protein
MTHQISNFLLVIDFLYGPAFRHLPRNPRPSFRVARTQERPCAEKIRGCLWPGDMVGSREKEAAFAANHSRERSGCLWNPGTM